VAGFQLGDVMKTYEQLFDECTAGITVSQEQRTLGIAFMRAIRKATRPKFDPKLTYVDVNFATIDEMVTLGLDYNPGSPGVHTLRNGDPGYPDDPGSLDICEVWLNGVEIAAALHPDALIQLTESAWMQADDIDRDRAEAYYDLRNSED
jgi:hypothetical protein